ncbi:MAG TPA: CHAT domain-containing tetratricopeptide repeat protein [Stellaceae bacterium]|nr:CHAT domain-containing tetratricopeptide repeat protein [Stellaceae bacterium]
MISDRTARVALVLALALALSACGELPPDAKVSTTPAGTTATAASQRAGTNQMGEPCRFEPSGDALGSALAAAYNVYCGTWQQPSGRIFEGATPAGSEALQRLAVSSPWRVALNESVDCEEPSAIKVLTDEPAELMRCSRKSGDWPHLALVADVAGKTYFLDGVPSALPALETALAMLSGQAEPSADASSKMAEISAAISSHPFGSGDLDAYFSLMRLGNAANDGGNYAAAEQAFRSALAVQERILGPSDPGLATPIMNLALQISNQGRYLEADQLFARANQLVSEATDPLETARYDLYIAEHETNRSNLTEAEASNALAERQYLALVPSSLVDAARGFTETRTESVADSLMLGPEGQNAVAGLAASWTLGALIAYRKGDYDRVNALNNSVDVLLRISGLRPPGLEPRAVRLAALGDARVGEVAKAVTKLTDAAQLFAHYGENERPVAVTLFLAGRSALAGGRREEALALFHKGAAMARGAHLGLPEALVGDYLEAIDQVAATNSDREAFAAEMFTASQLIQGNVTGQVVAQAFARLAAADLATRDLLRQMQDDDLKLQQLYAARDQETRLPAAQVGQDKIKKIDTDIASTQADRADADSAAQSASPDYARLVSKDVSVVDVQAVLGAREGLVSFVVGGNVTFAILVEKSHIEEYRIALTPFELAKSVARLRATIVPGEVSGEDRLPEFDVGAAHALYEKLLGPIEKRLDALERLVIVPGGALSSLPLEVLVTSETQPVTDGNYKNVPFLIKKLAISYMPAPQTLVVLRGNTRPSSAPNPYIGFGDFRPATRAQIGASYPPSSCTRDFLSLVDLPPLPGTRREIDAVGRLVFHVPQNDMVLGPDFTKARLTGADLTKFRIVHLATHALLPSELRCRSEPLIALSADPAAKDASSAFLGLSEILTLKLDADLVLLSACNTAGPGAAGTGDALSGLAKAFFFAGARGLMVTHWELEDTAGPVLTALTLSPWGTARDSAADLRRAKLYMIVALGSKPGPSFAFFTHPFAWAPFVLIGDGIRAAAASS